MILAGVTIVTLARDNGLLEKFTTAKELELIKLAVSEAQFEGEGILTEYNLNNNLINLRNNSINVEKISYSWKITNLYINMV